RPARARRDGTPLDDLPQVASALAGPEEIYAEGSRAEFVRKALSLLPPEQRAAIDLGFFSGLSQSEIAEELDIPLGTVKSRTRLGMNRLREMLMPLQGGVVRRTP